MFFRFSRYIVHWYIAAVSLSLSLAISMYLSLLLFTTLTGLPLHMASFEPYTTIASSQSWLWPIYTHSMCVYLHPYRVRVLPAVFQNGLSRIHFKNTFSLTLINFEKYFYNLYGHVHSIYHRMLYWVISSCCL